MRKTVIGIMGPGAGASAENLRDAYALGQAIAAQEWVVLTGGRAAGVMDAASRGAKEAGGFTIGILPGKDYQGLSQFVDVAICTDMGNGRNNINVLSADVVIAVGMGMGTLSEVALAVKNQKPVLLLLRSELTTQALFQELAPNSVIVVSTVPEAIAHISRFLKVP